MTSDVQKRTLTLEDIQSSEYLRKEGILSGDVFNEDTGEIERVFSKPEDSVSQGSMLTQEDIASSPYLQENNVVAGDRFYDGEIHRSAKDDAWTQFKYGMDKGGNLVGYGADILESYLPLGEVTLDFNGFSYATPDELHGEGYKAATPTERREMLVLEKERELQEDYGQFFEEDTDGIAGPAGGFVKALADPTTLIPIGAGYKTMAAASGALGAGYSVTEDFATTSEVDPIKAAITGLASAIAAPALVAGARVVSGKVASQAAEKLTVKAQNVLNKSIAEGAPIDKPAQALMDAGFNPAQVEAAFKATGKQLRIPATATRAEKALEQALIRDSAVSRQFSDAIDYHLGALSTQVRNISEPVFGRLRRYEFNTHANTQAVLKEVEPFLKGLSEIAPAVKSRIAHHLFNGNTKAAEGLMQANSPALHASFVNNVKGTLTKVGENLKEVGHTFEGVENYFPRLVKDYAGLRASLGKAEQGKIGKALSDYAQRKKIPLSSLSEQERTEVIDLTLRGYRMDPSGAKPRFIKPRTLNTIQPEQLKYYSSPEESLSMYLRGSIDDIEKRKFLGKGSTQTTSGAFDPDTSIGNYIDAEIEAGNIPVGKEGALVELLKSRFIGGAQSPGKINSFLRNTGYMGTIANPLSAMTQLGDIGLSASLKGFRNTIGSMLGTKEMGLIDLGLENMITTELGSGVDGTARALAKMLKGVGFQRIDKLGKETYINASLKKARNMVKSEAGEQAFRKRQGNVYGDELDALVADLKSGTVSTNVKFHLFNELADVQPIALSEHSPGYLDNPNHRILYMLKSFTLKMYDVVRRDIVKEWKQGNKVTAAKNAGLLAGYLTVANTGIQTTKDIILGREVRPEDIPDRAVWALLGVFGANKYVSERYVGRGDIKGAVVNTLVPATPLIEAAIKGTLEPFKDDPDLAPVMKGIPVVGPLFYNWFGGGAEKYNERLDD